MEGFQIEYIEIFPRQNINENPSSGAANCVIYPRIGTAQKNEIFH